MADRHQRIAPTAHFTAYTWYRLRLPYAQLFATARGAALFWTLRLTMEWAVMVRGRVPTMAQYLGQRHRVIDWVLAEHAPDRVVELGAGLSRRGTTWAADRGTRYTEIDLPHMIAAKRALLAARAPETLRATLAERLEHRSLDVVSPDFGGRLAELLAGAARPVVVAEGLLGYLTLEQRLRLLGAIREALASAGGGTFVHDAHLSESQARVGAASRVLRSLIGVVTRGQGVRDPFPDAAAAEAAYREAGYTRIERFQPLALLDRVPGLARVYAPVNIYALGVERR